MLIAGAASAVGYNGKFEFPKIGSEYDAVSSTEHVSVQKPVSS